VFSVVPRGEQFPNAPGFRAALEKLIKGGWSSMVRLLMSWVTLRDLKSKAYHFLLVEWRTNPALGEGNGYFTDVGGEPASRH